LKRLIVEAKIVLDHELSDGDVFSQYLSETIGRIRSEHGPQPEHLYEAIEFDKSTETVFKTDPKSAAIRF
jgi:hypothetical protein